MHTNSDEDTLQGTVVLKYDLSLQAYGSSTKRKAILDSYLDHIQKMEINSMEKDNGEVRIVSNKKIVQDDIIKWINQKFLYKYHPFDNESETFFTTSLAKLVKKRRAI